MKNSDKNFIVALFATIIVLFFLYNYEQKKRKRRTRISSLRRNICYGYLTDKDNIDNYFKNVSIDIKNAYNKQLAHETR